MFRLALVCFLFTVCASLRAQTTEQKHEYEGSDELPVVKIDGESVKIHSQGLFVTKESYLVTGRLEAKPKRASLLRFSRTDDSHELFDITPKEIGGKTLDHPGGFDMDEKGRFWIPLSTSNRAGPSLICAYEIEEEQPLSNASLAFTFDVDDHIGAVCCVGDRLYGANWDTKSVYVWDRKGKLERKIDRGKLFAQTPDWQVAVQDWKHLEVDGKADRIILGGIDKSNLLRRATVQVIDPMRWEIVESYTLDQRKDVKRPLTNEGLCVQDGKLYLLPEDIGDGAKVLRFTEP